MGCVYKTPDGKVHRSKGEVAEHLNNQDAQILEPNVRVFNDNVIVVKEYLNEDGSIKTKTETINQGTVLENMKSDIPGVRSYVDAVLSESRREAARGVMNKFQKVIPNVVINYRSTDDALNLTGRADRKGWVDDTGVNIVTDNFTTDTFVHELTEVFMYYLEQFDTVKHNSIMNLARESMQDNIELVNLIKESYDFKDNNDLVREYIATVSGFGSEQNVMSFLNQHKGQESSQTESKGLFNSVRSFIKELFNSIGGMFNKFGYDMTSNISSLDLSRATFKDVIEAINRDVQEGNSFFSEVEGEMLMNKMNADIVLKSEKYFSNTIFSTTKVHSSADFESLFMTDQYDKVMEDLSGSSKQRLDQLYYMSREDNSGNRYIYYKNKRYDLGKGTYNEIINALEKAVLPEISKHDKTRLGRIDSFIRGIDVTSNLSEQIFDVVKDVKVGISYNAMKKLLAHTGLARGFVNIMRYSELKNSKESSLNALYDSKMFEGVDPYIIIHDKKEDGGFNISILDLSSDNLHARNKNIENKNILGKIMSDSKYEKLGGTLRNDLLGVKQVQLGLLAAHILKSNPKINIANISTFSIPVNGVKFHSTSNIGELFKQLDIIGQQKKIVDMIEDKGIQILITDRSLLTKDFGTNIVEELAQVFGNVIGFGQKAINNAGMIREGRLAEVDMADFVEGIKKQMRIMEATKGADQVKNDDQYRLLSEALMELDLKIDRKFLMKGNKDITKLHETIATSHNIKNPIAKAVVLGYTRAKFSLLNYVKDKMTSFHKERNAFYQRHKLDDTSNYLISRVFNASSKIYEPLYQKHLLTVIRKDKNGREVRTKERKPVPLFFHYDLENQNTKRALLNNEITKEDVAFGKKIKEIVEEEQIQNIIYDSKVRGKELSRENAQEILSSTTNFLDNSEFGGQFFLPVIYKSKAELMLSGIKKAVKGDYNNKDLSAGISKVFTELGNENELFIDVSGQEDVNQVTNDFKSQMADITQSLNMAGMRMEADGTLSIVNEEKYNQISTNVEALMHSFLLSNTRSRIYDDMLLPIYNAAYTLLQKIKDKDGKDMKNTVSWLKEHFMTLVERKSPDMEGKDTWYKNAAKTVRFTQRVFSNVTLGYNIKVALKNQLIMEEYGGVAWWANELAKIGITKEAKNDLANMPEFLNPKTFAKAHGFVTANWHYSWTLARKFQNIEGTEFDIIHNPAFNIHKQHMANSSIAHFANMGGDNLLRTTAVVSYLMELGALDAYVYDNVEGTVSYDITKDKRYSDENGRIRKDKEFLVKNIYEDNVKTNFQNPDNPNLEWGDNYMSMYRIKRIMDKHAVGSLSEEASWQLSNHWIGRSVSLFRTWSNERLFNALGQNQETFRMSYYSETDAAGNRWSRQELIEAEGLASSIMETYSYFKNFENWNKADFVKYWQEAPHTRRVNLIKANLKLAVSAILIGMFKAFQPDEEADKFSYRAFKDVERYYKFLYSDLYDLQFLGGVERNPLPAWKFWQDIYNVILNDQELNTLLRYTPGYNGTYKYIIESGNQIKAATGNFEAYEKKYEQEAEKRRLKREEMKREEELKNK